RFHALLTAMPAGVASIGLASDERVPNLFEDEPWRVIDVRSAGLADRLKASLAALKERRAGVADASARTSAEETRLLRAMPAMVAREVGRFYPAFRLERS